MKDFLLVYRMDYSMATKRTAEEEQANMKRWMDWLGSIGAQNKLIDRGNRLEEKGKVVKTNNVITNGPYSDIKESIGGYSLVRAESLDVATEMAKGCPVLLAGGNVEVREISKM
ncbi:MAG TPA: transcription initiation protein [Cytophagales bacterium]|nr:transcription initiation protein [Cytophagales bacterium]